MATAAAGTWPLVGRDGLVAEAEAQLRRGRGVAFIGEAGVGKTRLAQQVVAPIRARGRVVRRAAGSASVRGVPLGALAAIADLGEVRDADLAATLARAGARLAGTDDVLFVDDAHLLDDASAAVLHQVALAGAPVVVTLRRGEPMPDAVLTLWKDELVGRVDVPPLRRAEVEEVVAAVLGGAVDGMTEKALWEASEGNVLYLRELVLGALDTGVLGDEGGLWRLRDRRPASPRLDDLVGARLGRLGDTGRRCLELLAVGGELGRDLVVALASQDGLDELEAAAIVRVASDGRRRPVRLEHPVYGEVVRRSLASRRVADVSEALWTAVGARGARRRDDVLRLAVWHREAGVAPDGELALAAARLAAVMHEDELVEDLARAAVDAGTGPDAVLLLGAALARRGRVDEAEATFAGVDLAALGEEDVLLHAVARADNLFWALGRPSEATAVVVKASARLRDPARRAELAGNGAVYAFMDGRPQDAIAAVEGLVGEVSARASVTGAMALTPSLAVCGRADDGVTVADGAIAARSGVGADDVRLTELPMLLMARGSALGPAGRLGEATDTVATGYDLAVEGGDRHGEAWCAMILGQTALLRGRPGSARRWFTEGAVKFAEVGLGGLRRACLAGAGHGAALQGDAATAANLLGEVRSLDPVALATIEPDVCRALAAVRAVTGDLTGAAAALAEGRDRATAMGADYFSVLVSHEWVRQGRAAEVVDLVVERAVGQQGRLVPALADHARAAAAGDADALVEAGAALEATGAMLLAAEALAQAAAAARHRGDERAARRHGARSHQLARDCEGARTPALELAGEAGRLTDREREVARRVAAGAANKDVARQLGVSVRTVETHLARVYRKLGVDRAGLAAALDTTAAP